MQRDDFEYHNYKIRYKGNSVWGIKLCNHYFESYDIQDLLDLIDRFPYDKTTVVKISAVDFDCRPVPVLLLQTQGDAACFTKFGTAWKLLHTEARILDWHTTGTLLPTASNAKEIAKLKKLLAKQGKLQVQSQAVEDAIKVLTTKFEGRTLCCMLNTIKRGA